MKNATLTTIAVLILGATVPPGSKAQDVGSYGIGKFENLTQTSTASPTINSFGFSADVEKANGGSLVQCNLESGHGLQ
jgi:hypothetical protein